MSFSAAKAARHLSPYPRAGLALLQHLIKQIPVVFSAPLGAGLFLLCFFSASLCRAEIFIDSRIGFHGVFQLGRPFPLEVELSNSGAPAEGVLEVRVWKGGATKGGAPFPVYYRREVFLSAQARKTVQFTVDPDFISRPLTISFLSPAGQASRELDLRRNFSPAPVLLLVSESSSAPAVSLGSLAQNRLVALALTELPADSRALLGVSHLILYDQSLRDLSRYQLVALEGWLSAGGRMVILGSLNFALYQEPALGRFMPVRVTGTKRISFVPQLSQGERPTPIADVWAQISTVVAGKVLLESQGLPVLVETSRGKGRIVYLSVDVGRPPLAQWVGLPKLLQNLLAPVGSEDSTPRTQWDETVFAQLFLSPSFISNYVPTGSLLLGMAGYLIGIGVIAWLWQGKRLPVRPLLAGFLAFVTVSTLAGYLFFSRGGNIPDGVLLSATVLESSADGFVDGQANLALFSTQMRQYSLRLERGWVDLTAVANRPREGSDQAVMLQDGSGSSRYQLALREWDYKLFRMRFVERFPVRAEFAAQGDKLLMKMDNRSAKDLTDCWLLVPGQRYPLGDLPRGSSWRKVFALAGAKPAEETGSSRADAMNFRDVTFADKTRDVLFHASFFPRDGEAGRWSGGTGVFFGWVKEPEPRVRVDDRRIRHHDYTLFRAIIPLASSEDE